MGRFSLGSTSLFPGHCLITLLRTGTRERRVHDLLSPLAAWARWRGGWGWTLGSLSLHHCLWAFTHSNSVPSSSPGHFLGSGVRPASLKSRLQVHMPFWWESPPSSTYCCLSDCYLLLPKWFPSGVPSNNHHLTAPSSVGQGSVKGSVTGQLDWGWRAQDGLTQSVGWAPRFSSMWPLSLSSCGLLSSMASFSSKMTWMSSHCSWVLREQKRKLPGLQRSRAGADRCHCHHVVLSKASHKS